MTEVPREEKKRGRSGEGREGGRDRAAGNQVTHAQGVCDRCHGSRSRRVVA